MPHSFYKQAYITARHCGAQRQNRLVGTALHGPVRACTMVPAHEDPASKPTRLQHGLELHATRLTLPDLLKPRTPIHTV